MIKLLLKSGEDSRELVFLEENIGIGRSSDNQLPLADKKVSRKHARIEKEGDVYRVVDLDSGNGIKVNGQDVKTHALAKGDEVKIGLSTLFVLDLDTPAPAAAAPAAAAPAAIPPAPAPAAAPAPAPAAAPEAPKAEEKDNKAEEKKPEVRRRSHVHTRRALPQKSSGGKYAGIAAALVIVGAIGYALAVYKNEIFGSPKKTAGTATKAEDPAKVASKEAGEQLRQLQQEAGAAATVTQDLIDRATALNARYGSIEPGLGNLLTQLRDRRSQQLGAMTIAEVETHVNNALAAKKYAEAIESLKALKGTGKEGDAAPILKRVLEEVERDYQVVRKAGQAMEDSSQYTAASNHYRQHAERFKGTEFYKPLADKPKSLELLAQVEMDLAASQAAAKKPEPKPLLAKAEPKPAMKRPEPVMKKPEPQPLEPTPAPAMKKPAMAMKKPAMDAPKPTKAIEPEPAAAQPIAVPDPEAPTKSLDAAFAGIFGKAGDDVRPSRRGMKRRAPTERPKITKPKVLCEAKRTRKGMFCPLCQRVLDPEYDVRQGVCKACDTEPVKIDMCVKLFFQAACHPEKVGPKPIFC